MPQHHGKPPKNILLPRQRQRNFFTFCIVQSIILAKHRQPYLAVKRIGMSYYKLTPSQLHRSGCVQCYSFKSSRSASVHRNIPWLGTWRIEGGAQRLCPRGLVLKRMARREWHKTAKLASIYRIPSHDCPSSCRPRGCWHNFHYFNLTAQQRGQPHTSCSIISIIPEAFGRVIGLQDRIHR